VLSGCGTGATAGVSAKVQDVQGFADNNRLDRLNRLWVLKFDKSLSDYAIP